MTNEEMKPERYLRWAKARSKIARVRKHLESGGKIIIGTHTRASVYDKRHVEMFRATRSGAYVQRGQAWDCIDFSGIRFA